MPAFCITRAAFAELIISSLRNATSSITTLPVPLGVRYKLLLVTAVEIMLDTNVKLLSTVNELTVSPVELTVILFKVLVVNNSVLFVGCANTEVLLSAEYTPAKLTVEVL